MLGVSNRHFLARNATTTGRIEVYFAFVEFQTSVTDYREKVVIAVFAQFSFLTSQQRWIMFIPQPVKFLYQIFYFSILMSMSELYFKFQNRIKKFSAGLKLHSWFLFLCKILMIAHKKSLWVYYVFQKHLKFFTVSLIPVVH